MNMTKKLLARVALAAAAAFAAQSAGAAETTADAAKTAAVNWARRSQRALGAKFSADARARTPLTVRGADGKALFHAVNMEGGGFVIAAGDDNVRPIVAFSGSGEFDPSEGNPLYAILYKDMDAKIRMANSPLSPKMAADPSATSAEPLRTVTAKEEWAALEDRVEKGGGEALRPFESESSLPDVRVAPLVESRWGQSSFGGGQAFNYYTPEHYVCGCVATAIAQVMRYWSEPSWNVTPGEYLCYVDKADSYLTMMGGSYDWANMPLVSSECRTETQRRALGKLLYDVGVASEMSWSSGGSGTFGTISAKALRERFRYASACAYYGNAYSLENSEEHMNAILASIDAKMPVTVGISSSSSGHEVVLDGYGYKDGSLYVHMNCGWTGSGDLWYRLMEDEDGVTGYWYSALDEVVYNINPYEAGDVISGRATDSSGRPAAGATVFMSGNSRTVTAVTDANGIYSFRVTAPGAYEISAAKGTLGSETRTVTVRALSSNAEIIHYGGRGYLTEFGSVANVWGANLALFNANAKPDLLFQASSGWAVPVFLAAASGATSGKTSFVSGESVYLYAAFANQGAAAITNDYTIRHEVLDASSGSVLHYSVYNATESDKIPAGSGRRWNGWNWTGLQNLAPGAYIYRCILDAGGTVVESDESNNVATFAFTVSERAPDTVRVVFDPNGGTLGFAASEAVYTVGRPYGSLPSAERAGWIFAGWNTGAETGTPVTADTIVSADITRLYARWTRYVPVETLNVPASGGTVSTTPVWNDGATNWVFQLSSRPVWIADIVLLYGNGSSARLSGSSASCSWTGSGSLNISAGANPSPVARSWTLVAKTAAGETVWSVTVSQAGSTSPAVALGEALDNYALSFATGGDGIWFGQSVESSDGEDSAQSGQLDHLQMTWIDTSVSGPGELSFAWKVSSERGYDKLELLLDGSTVTNISGSVGWLAHTLPVAAGSHTIRWRYSKDSSVSSGSDCGWLDRVSWRQSAEISFDANGGTVSPQSKTFFVGEPFGELPVPVLSGRVFEGWYTALSGGTRVTAATAVTRDIRTLYARWSDAISLAEALDNGELAFATGGDAYWYGQSDVTSDGHDAARSGAIAEQRSTWFEAPVEGPGRIEFKWNVSSEAGYDRLSFLVDGGRVDAISGETGWMDASFDIGNGRHVLRWEYSKDASVDRGSDCGWVDAVRWTPSGSMQTVEISFRPNGGDIGDGPQYGSAKRSYPAGARFGTLPLPVRDGYVFKHWYCTVLGINIYEDTFVPAEPVTVYALWEPDGNFANNIERDGLRFTTGGNVNWFGYSTMYAQSGGIFNGQSNWIETQVEGDGTLSFEWMTSSEEDWDVLSLEIDGVRVAEISGETEWWEKQSFKIEGVGAHIVRFAYSKDSSVSHGEDWARVRRVSWKAASDDPDWDENAQYGPFGRLSDVARDDAEPVVLRLAQTWIEQAWAEPGDCVAAYRRDNGALCGLGMVRSAGGRVTIVFQVEEGVDVHFKVWRASSGLENPQIFDCDGESDLTMPEPGTSIDGWYIICSGPSAQTISLANAGWHPVSFSVIPQDASAESVFGDVARQLDFVAAGDASWWDPVYGEGTLENIAAGGGYWVKTVSPGVAWTVYGNPDTRAPIPLKDGWNLVGYTPLSASPASVALETAYAAGLVEMVVEPSTGAFWPDGGLDRLAPGRAYYIYASRPGTLVYDRTVVYNEAFLAGKEKAEAGPFAAAQIYGPFGDGSDIRPDGVLPTVFRRMSVKVNGWAAAAGDCVAVYRGDTGALCGLGRVVRGADGATIAINVSQGVPLSFRVWRSGTGEVLDADETLDAPAPGSFVEGFEINVEGEMVEVTVAFRPEGGTGEMLPRTFGAGIPQALPPCAFSRTGYAFAGWALSSGGDVEYADCETAAFGADTELFAVWEHLPVYSVSFAANGGRGSMQAVEFTQGVPQALPPCAFTRSGYVFAGWALSSGGGKAYSDGEEIAVDSPLALYALWAKAYKLTVKNGLAFNAANPSGASSLGVAEGSIVQIEPVLAQGSVFTGWTWAPVKQSLGGEFDPSSSSTSIEMPASAVTLTANSIANPAWISVEVGGVDETLNGDFLPEGVVEWSADSKTWFAADGSLRPVKSGKATISLRSLDARWTVPAKLVSNMPVVSGGEYALSAEAARVSVVQAFARPEPGAGGTVSTSPANGQVLPGKSVTASARPASGSVFAYWDLDDGTRAFTASVKLAPETDLSAFAVFRAKSSATAPVLDETSWSGPAETGVGTAYEGVLSVDDSAYPVKFSATGLPPGLKIDASSGVVSGTPMKAGRFTATLTATSQANTRLSGSLAVTIDVVAVPSWLVGTFNGVCASESGPLTYGTASVTVTDQGKVSAKFSCEGTNWTMSAASVSFDSQTALISGTAKSGSRTMGVELFAEAVEPPESAPSLSFARISGILETADGASCETLVYRNVWKDKGATAAASAFLGRIAGSYAVGLASSSGSLPGGTCGTGYLSLSVDAKGNAKFAGKLADGTSVSGTVPVAWDGAPVALFCTCPSAYKGGCAYIPVQIDMDSGIVSGLGGGWWSSRNPQATGEYGAGFAEDLEPYGAFCDKSADLRELYGTLRFGAEVSQLEASWKYTYFNEAGRKVSETDTIFVDPQDTLGQDGNVISVNAAGTGFTVQKATKPVQDRETKEWRYDGANDGALTFSFTRATGLFKGTYTFWYDYESAYDETKDASTMSHTSKKVSFEGVAVPGDGGMYGFFLKDCTGVYTDAKTGKEKTYKYKQSLPAAFTAE